MKHSPEFEFTPTIDIDALRRTLGTREVLEALDELERHRSALAELFAAIPDDYDAEEAGRLDNEHTIKRIQEAARGAYETVDPPDAEPWAAMHVREEADRALGESVRAACRAAVAKIAVVDDAATVDCVRLSLLDVLDPVLEAEAAAWLAERGES